MQSLGKYSSGRVAARKLWWGYKGYNMSIGSVEQSVQSDKTNFTALKGLQNLSVLTQ